MVKLTPTSAHSPTYNDETGNSVFLYVKFEEFEDELPFAATTYDVMDYGRQLYANAVAGMYGPVAPFVPPEPAADQPVANGVQTL
jgi:hypothetical protein